MNLLLSGAIGMASAVAGLFFLRFWRSTRDRFFLYFALSFWIEAANRVLIARAGMHHEVEPTYYVIRLVAYLLIVVAIAEKNRFLRDSS